ncbi:hypothetical protein L1987_65251 [Smallanthus sonchifolius]|uniref:Uncharacterized protein n=1 Tax=Smallanthus sonchifolius TaxID=185202 RepID=A0ACB9BTX8_9ASTR|nr:hypothetical protein L1987_65251 [Smallanthus sonchifolius]
MSDNNIPFKIQVEIIKRLPLKSLIQFRSVSKTWKSLIDGSDFVAHYSGQQQHLLVRYEDPDDSRHKYVCIADDDSFPQHKVSPTIPVFVNMLKTWRIIGSSHGLVCLYDRKGMAAVWNPSIRKAVAVVVPDVTDRLYATVLGFGVCREASVPKIVKIRHMENTSCQVEVFTLTTEAWRTPHGNLPPKSIRFGYYKLVINGFLYWLATHRDDGFDHYSLIISFDMTCEEFRQVNLPDSLAHRSHVDLSLSMLRESLVVLECDLIADNLVFHVWMMEDGVPVSFTKLFPVNVNTPDAPLVCVCGFRKTGEPVIEIKEAHHDSIVSLAVYESYSKSINNLGINGIICSFSVYPYMETLLLLDQPDFVIYDKVKGTTEDCTSSLEM